MNDHDLMLSYSEHMAIVCIYVRMYVCAILHAGANVYYYDLHVHGLCVLLHGFHVAESNTFSVNTYQPRL